MARGFEDLVAQHPWVLFLAIAILPGLGVPNCPLLVLCGTAMTVALGIREAVYLAIGAVIANILWTYWVAAYPFREFLRERVDRRACDLLGDRFRMTQRGVLYMTLLLHITPGVPLFIQNYFPGLHRLAFWKYLSIAIPVQSLYTALIVITSGQIFAVVKHYPALVAGIGLAVWAAIVIYRRRRTKSPAV